jgi:hypothetical protein
LVLKYVLLRASDLILVNFNLVPFWLCLGLASLLTSASMSKQKYFAWSATGDVSQETASLIVNIATYTYSNYFSE